MVCIVCLSDYSPITLNMGDDDVEVDYETVLCREHGRELQEVIRKWIRVNRETAVVSQSADKNKKWDKE